MKYSDGSEIRIGDYVKLFQREAGIVVFSVDANEYSHEYPKKEWLTVKSGLMIKTVSGALVHLDAIDASKISRLENL